MSVYILSHPVQLISQGFASVLALHREHRLKGFLLGTQDLNFFLVDIEVFRELSNGLVEIGKLALQM